jgi:hypothetical protein
MAGCHAQHQPAEAGQANLAWMARIRVYTASTDPRLVKRVAVKAYVVDSSSTSKTSVAFGPILGGLPAAP